MAVFKRRLGFHHPREGKPPSEELGTDIRESFPSGAARVGLVCCINAVKMMCQRVCTAGGKKNVGKISPAGPAWVDDSTVTGCK